MKKMGDLGQYSLQTKTVFIKFCIKISRRFAVKTFRSFQPALIRQHWCIMSIEISGLLMGQRLTATLKETKD